jgi:hypothetical protein
MAKSIRREILDEIDAFMALHDGMTPTRLGLLVVNDGHAVSDLRTGTGNWTMERIDHFRNFIRTYKVTSPKRRQPEAA